jgi:uracil-DNA glycosylase
MSLEHLLRDVTECQLCGANLPFGPRPVLRLASTARLLIIGQAPGSKEHQTGIPWDGKSGDRLRDWMNLGPLEFYDEARIALMPMGFCYPGAATKGGDNPPRPECAPRWHERLLKHLPNLQLTLLVGQYSQRHYLERPSTNSMTETVKAFMEYVPRFFPLPHPSWRSTIWMRRHPWFEAAVLPTLRNLVRETIGTDGGA